MGGVITNVAYVLEDKLGVWSIYILSSLTSDNDILLSLLSSIHFANIFVQLNNYYHYLI